MNWSHIIITLQHIQTLISGNYQYNYPNQSWDYVGLDEGVIYDITPLISDLVDEIDVAIEEESVKNYFINMATLLKLSGDVIFNITKADGEADESIYSEMREQFLQAKEVYGSSTQNSITFTDFLDTLVENIDDINSNSSAFLSGYFQKSFPSSDSISEEEALKIVYDISNGAVQALLCSVFFFSNKGDMNSVPAVAAQTLFIYAKNSYQKFLYESFQDQELYNSVLKETSQSVQNSKTQFKNIVLKASTDRFHPQANSSRGNHDKNAAKEEAYERHLANLNKRIETKKNIYKSERAKRMRLNVWQRRLDLYKLTNNDYYILDCLIDIIEKGSNLAYSSYSDSLNDLSSQEEQSYNIQISKDAFNLTQVSYVYINSFTKNKAPQVSLLENVYNSLGDLFNQKMFRIDSLSTTFSNDLSLLEYCQQCAEIVQLTDGASHILDSAMEIASSTCYDEQEIVSEKEKVYSYAQTHSSYISECIEEYGKNETSNTLTTLQNIQSYINDIMTSNNWI